MWSSITLGAGKQLPSSIEAVLNNDGFKFCFSEASFTLCANPGKLGSRGNNSSCGKDSLVPRLLPLMVGIKAFSIISFSPWQRVMHSGNSESISCANRVCFSLCNVQISWPLLLPTGIIKNEVVCSVSAFSQVSRITAEENEPSSQILAPSRLSFRSELTPVNTFTWNELITE